jgi:hypothetical protein
MFDLLVGSFTSPVGTIAKDISHMFFETLD